MSNLMAWLFTDPQTEMANLNLSSPAPYPNLLFLVVIGTSFLIAFYYTVEGRKRIPFIKDNRVWKYIFDRMLKSHLPIWALVGLFVVGFHFIPSFFAWRIWTVLWVAWGVSLVGYWIVYFVRDFPRHIVGYEKKIERTKFLPSRNQ